MRNDEHQAKLIAEMKAAPVTIEDIARAWASMFEKQKGFDRGRDGDLRYAGLAPDQVPLTECLKDTVARVLPFWNDTMAPAIRSGQRVVVAAHGNSIRALVKYLDNISDSDIVGLNIPNGIPLVYELDASLKPIRHYYLGDAEAAAKAAAAVASQGRG